MDLRAEALHNLNATEAFFNRSTRCLLEEDSAFRPTPQTMSAAGHVAHAAQVIDWFREGAFAGNWRMDFEVLQAATDRETSLTKARAEFARAIAELKRAVESASDAALAETLPDNPILPGRPRVHVVEAVQDHTGHHRGALAVYARLCGRVPEMPYAEE